MPRPSARERGYTTEWDKASAAFRVENPRCAMCLKRGKLSRSRVVDHIIPHKGDMALFWDAQNWQALCVSCHSSLKQQIERDGYTKEIDAVTGFYVDPDHPANKKYGK